MTPLGIAAAVVGGLVVWLAVSGFAATLAATTARRAARRRTYTNLTLHKPPVPESDSAWLDELPVDVLSPREVALRCQRLEASL